MTTTSLLYPVFAQVLLTLLVLILMGRARARSLASSRTNPNKREVALGEHKWSDEARKAANNFSNQFELPVLFYAAMVIAILLKQSDVAIVALAWGFVLMRILHAILHIGPNIVRMRFLAYFAGVLFLIGLWGTLAWRVLAGAAVL